MGRLYPDTILPETTLPSVISNISGGRLYGGETQKAPTQDISSVEGLLKTAETAGLGERAKKVLEQKGEKPKAIYSGGFVMDIFDTLNALQYGVVGLMKGKNFKEGVKTRQSFSDKDALGDYGLPGMIGGIALDIAVDPLTYIPVFGAGKALWKVAGKAGKIAGKVAKIIPTPKAIAGAENLGDSLGRAFIYRFGQDPLYAEIAERSIRNIAVGNQNLLEIARPLTKLDAPTQRAIAEARKAGELIPEIAKPTKKAILKVEPLAQEARKYKSVEEFVSGIKKEVPIKADRFGYANYQETIRSLPPKKPNDIRLYRAEGGRVTYKTSPFKKTNIQPLPKEFVKGDTTFYTPELHYAGIMGKEYGAKVHYIDIPKSLAQKINETEYLVSKSQLTDFYNLAKQPQVKPIAEAVKELPKGLTPEILAKAKPAFDELDRLGKEAVDVGLLKHETYTENVGKYIARLYRKHEMPEGIVGKIKGVFEKKPLRIDISRFKKRTDIPEDIREAMGEILEAGYPTAKALVQLNHAVERAKFFTKVAETWAKDTIEKGFSQLPDVKTLGKLAGKAVPTPIFDDIQELIRIKTPAERVLNKVVGGFKFSKVILNPAAHARNIMSNFLLNNFEGLSPARLDVYGKAAKQIATKGDIYQEARKVGLGLDTFVSRELKDVLLGPEGATIGRKFGSHWKTVVNKLGDIYQKEEEFAKMAQYIFQKGKGLSPEDAFKVAERATFNYAQVTPFIRRVRESLWGFPFITFTYKATPQVVKTLITKPTKISNIGKIKTAIENQSDLKELERERASEPEWIRDGFYIKMPVKDKFGRSAYLDLSYIMPFGDLITGNYLERDIKRETGLPESPAEAAIKKLPFINLIRELGRNQDFYGNKIVRESDPIGKQLNDVYRHLIKLYAPPIISELIPGGFRPTGERRPSAFKRVLEVEKGGIEAGGAQTRTLMQELLRQVGLKISPVDVELQEKFMESEKRRALETLLGEEGITRKFQRTYIPKEKIPEKKIPTSGRRLYP